LEQDTGKSFIQSGSSTLLDFNRVSHPLIEIISMPDIHHPSTAAAYVRKVQSVLKGIGAVTAGMEMGGLRADVNVSVRRRGQHSTTATQSYYGIEKLGQRTEIKNLSSFKAIEDAIIAEKRRQILILQQGGTVEGETRGWTLGGTETHKLRDKEGEVDYRYMPDPDLGPLIIPTVRFYCH
jgi:aspartyl-tRNA(Asn)/glutamyl-tRNA(Gln) amidotransferase subunit B